MRTHETDIPLHLFHHGENFKAYQTMGAHPIVKDKKSGYVFRVWAPRAKSVSLIGDFNHWNESAHPNVWWMGKLLRFSLRALNNTTHINIVLRRQTEESFIKPILTHFIAKHRGRILPTHQKFTIYQAINGRIRNIRTSKRISIFMLRRSIFTR